MWKRDQAVKSDSGLSGAAGASSQQTANQPIPSQPTPNQQPSFEHTTPASAIPRPQGSRTQGDIMNIGKSVVIKGELNASEDLTLEGRVEGTIQLRDNILTIGTNGNITAKVFAKSVIVLGSVKGDITAGDKVDIRDGGSVDGNIVAPRVGITDGAHFRGSVDMQKKGTKPASAESSVPAQAPAQAQPKPAPASGQSHGAPVAAAPAR